MSRSRDGTWLTTRSPIKSRPREISSSPATIRRAVVLPQPGGPTRTMNSPSSIVRSSEFTAVVPSGYVFVTPSNVTPAIHPSRRADGVSYQIGDPLSQRVAETRLCRVGRMHALDGGSVEHGPPKVPPPEGKADRHDDGGEGESDRPVLQAEGRLASGSLPLTRIELVRGRVRFRDQIDAVRVPSRVVAFPGGRLVDGRHGDCDSGNAGDVEAVRDARRDGADEHEEKRRHQRPQPDRRDVRSRRVVPRGDDRPAPHPLDLVRLLERERR